jgi:DNA modification methylase
VKIKPIFSTTLGSLYRGRSEAVLTELLPSLEGKVNLIVTSPPFPLNKKKKYGNHNGEEYLEWLRSYGQLFSKLLAEDGSLVVEIGNAWEAGAPIQSLLPYRALIALVESGGFNLCQEVTYYNPARLPSPAQWVTVNRVRLKDATTKVWWMSKSAHPKADNRQVLQPYSKHMQRLLRTQKYNSGLRPSEHRISKTGFLKDNGGAIAPNLIQASNTQSNLAYQQFCRENEISGHPARMPHEIPDFFIKFLTDPGDLVLDPFGGSNTTGYSAENLNRRWISCEVNAIYAASSVSRFSTIAAKKLLTKFERAESAE